LGTLKIIYTNTASMFYAGAQEISPLNTFVKKKHTHTHEN